MATSPTPRLMRVVLIGVGAIADKMKKALADIPRARLVAASARTPGKAEAFLQNVLDEAGRPARGYTETALMLNTEMPDVAIDCSPSGDHFGNVTMCADLGVNCLSEKPSVMNLSQAEEAARRVSLAGVKAGGIFQHRYMGCYRELHGAVCAGRFGDLAAINICVPWYRDKGYYDGGAWRGKPESDGGAVMNQGSHEIDLALWLAAASMRLPRGQNPVSALTAFTANVAHRGVITVEDTATVAVQFRNGAVGSWYFSTAANSKEPGVKSVSVLGSGGSVIIAGNTVRQWDFVKELPTDEEVRQKYGVPIAGNAGKDPRAISHHDHRLNIEAFMDALDGHENGGSGFELDLVGAALAPVTIEAIYASAAAGGNRQVPPSLEHLIR